MKMARAAKTADNFPMRSSGCLSSINFTDASFTTTADESVEKSLGRRGDAHSHGQSGDIDEGAYLAFVWAGLRGFGSWLIT
jgi:hypothetical protein